ncbi:mitochondrial transcription factor B2 isoform X2 [Halictus rubicundus]
MSHVIELNPGLGFTTQQLLEIGVPFVHMYEKELRFFDTLNELCSKFPNKLSLQKADLYTVSKSMHINNMSNNTQNTYDLLNNVQHKQWSQENCMQIIGATNRVTFLRHLILSTVFQTCFMSYGRPIFYLTIPPSVWNKFTSPIMRPTSIMFQTIFNYHIFGKVDRKAFIPWNKGKIKKKLDKHVYKHSSTRVEQCTTNEDLSYLYVVKIEPKCKTRVSSHGKDLIYFWYFVRHNLYKPTARVIPSMEKLIPGCGVRLIAMNFNVFTQYRDLSIEQIYDLYLKFRSWPEFEESIFKSNAADIISVYNNYVSEEEGDHEIDNSSH